MICSIEKQVVVSSDDDFVGVRKGSHPMKLRLQFDERLVDCQVSSVDEDVIIRDTRLCVSEIQRTFIRRRVVRGGNAGGWCVYSYGVMKRAECRQNRSQAKGRVRWNMLSRSKAFPPESRIMKEVLFYGTIGGDLLGSSM